MYGILICVDIIGAHLKLGKAASEANMNTEVTFKKYSFNVSSVNPEKEDTYKKGCR